MPSHKVYRPILLGATIALSLETILLAILIATFHPVTLLTVLIATLCYIAYAKTDPRLTDDPDPTTDTPSGGSP